MKALVKPILTLWLQTKGSRLSGSRDVVVIVAALSLLAGQFGVDLSEYLPDGVRPASVTVEAPAAVQPTTEVGETPTGVDSAPVPSVLNYKTPAGNYYFVGGKWIKIEPKEPK